jgi:hypothetical protein
VSISLALSPEAQAVLRRFATELVELLEGAGDTTGGGTGGGDAGDEPLKRLFPPAYAGADHAEHETEYRRLMGDDLRRGHKEAAELMLATLDAEELDDEQAEAWLRGLNELRLVVGTVLDVSEEDEGPDDPDDPRASTYALYAFLTDLQAWLIEQMSDGL